MADEPVAGSGGKKWYQEQIGPLPAGVWLMVVAVAVIYTVIKKKNATTTNTPSTSAIDNSTQAGFDPNAIDPSTGLSYAQEMASGVAPGAGAVDPNTGIPYAQEFSTYPGGVAPGGGSGSGYNLQPITDNMSWERQAITVLVAKGYDPVLATQAMSDYINGVPLTPGEQAMESLAIQLIGPPPTPPLVAPSNTPGTGNNPPSTVGIVPLPAVPAGPTAAPSAPSAASLPVYTPGADPNGMYSSIPGYAPPPAGSYAKPEIAQGKLIGETFHQLPGG
jgi:hypothetical protein